MVQCFHSIYLKVVCCHLNRTSGVLRVAAMWGRETLPSRQRQPAGRQPPTRRASWAAYLAGTPRRINVQRALTNSKEPNEGTLAQLYASFKHTARLEDLTLFLNLTGALQRKFYMH